MDVCCGAGDRNYANAGTNKPCPHFGEHTSYLMKLIGARGRNRTDMPLRARDFESRASTSSTTRALKGNIYNVGFCSCQGNYPRRFGYPLRDAGLAFLAFAGRLGGAPFGRSFRTLMAAASIMFLIWAA